LELHLNKSNMIFTNTICIIMEFFVIPKVIYNFFF